MACMRGLKREVARVGEGAGGMGMQGAFACLKGRQAWKLEREECVS